MKKDEEAMKATPRTIQFFLPDGNARSIRIAEITSRIIQAIQIPRNKLSEAGKREETRNVGVYFLFGENEKTGESSVYIGEAEDCHSRLTQHNRGKDFWETAVIIKSKTSSFTKAHTKYLEWYCYEEAVKANRYALNNSTVPAKPFISEPVEADLMDNYETIKVLLSSLGFPVLEPLILSSKPSELLYCKGRGVEATGQYLDDGFLVFEGSGCQTQLVPSAGPFVKNSHRRLIDGEIVELQGDSYVFVKDHLFTSPSQAGAGVLGRNVNGWTIWKDSKGRTLDELKRK
jgi:predicted GIY-YIG superfamily endonuclease